MPEVPQKVIDQAVDALRSSSVHLTAFADTTPYQDDPSQSLWSRFQHPLAERCAAARKALLSAAETQEGEYARNQQEAVEHIRTLPPSERSAVANRPGQAPPSTQERT